MFKRLLERRARRRLIDELRELNDVTYALSYGEEIYYLKITNTQHLGERYDLYSTRNKTGAALVDHAQSATAAIKCIRHRTRLIEGATRVMPRRTRAHR